MAIMQESKVILDNFIKYTKSVFKKLFLMTMMRTPPPPPLTMTTTTITTTINIMDVSDYESKQQKRNVSNLCSELL